MSATSATFSTFRIRNGENIEVLDGYDNFYVGNIVSSSKLFVTVRIRLTRHPVYKAGDYVLIEREKVYYVEDVGLVANVSKNGEKPCLKSYIG